MLYTSSCENQIVYIFTNEQVHDKTKCCIQVRAKTKLYIYLQMSKFMIKPNVVLDAFGKTRLCIFYK